MRETAAILLIVWIVGLLLSRTFNGALHLLPLVAVVLLALSLRSSWRSRSAGNPQDGGRA